MEELLKQLTEQMKHGFDRLDHRLLTLEEGQRSLENGQKGMEGRLQSLEVGQQAIEGRLQSLEEGQRELEVGQQRLQSDVTIIKETVIHNLTEARSHMKHVESIQDRQQRIIEMLSARSFSHEADIHDLKSVLKNQKREETPLMTSEISASSSDPLR